MLVGASKSVSQVAVLPFQVMVGRRCAIALASAMNAWHNDPIRRYTDNRDEMNRYLRANGQAPGGDTTYVDMTQLA
jgi:hypothetical protein